MRCLAWRAAVCGLLFVMVGCGSDPPPPVDVSRAGDGGADASGACVDPMLARSGRSTVKGATPLGMFNAAGARSFGRCFWLELVSADGNCERHIVTVATGLRVPPWSGAEGSRLPVGVEIKAAAGGAAALAGGTLTIDSVLDPDGETPVARGTLSVKQPDWNLQGTFDAPWTDRSCN
jgi:hypothetical protein